ncbi:Peroxidase [Quillaja saponaria]|uniref:peroxidase n=1 Tax=Quillaja saponaria TaxID=32244 RepID=A0AAD7QIA1_QUISA|nr:Peroxidase [Quillaja saponaria]KAJ7982039.1 Peroxidase [Quillaja saponaria]
MRKLWLRIPKSDDNITRTLHLFSLRGFNERETVSLLGWHNIGKIGCDFIQQRLYNFQGTGQPEPDIPPDFLYEMRLNCASSRNNRIGELPAANISRMMSESDIWMSYLQALSSSMPSGATFDTHYYRSLLKGRGLLFADQQLTHIARVMLKMSNLDVLTRSQGEVRLNCSLPVSSFEITEVPTGWFLRIFILNPLELRGFTALLT